MTDVTKTRTPLPSVIADRGEMVYEESTTMGARPSQDELAAAAEGERGAPFTILLAVEGLESCDGRLLELGTTTWREGPMPLMIRDTDTHGGGEPAPTWPGGMVDEVFRDPDDESRIMGRGHLMPGETGARVEDIVRHAFRTVSIDGFDESLLGPERQATHEDQNGAPIKFLTRFADTYIDAVTLVRSPAFRCACLWFDDEEQPDFAATAHGGFVDPEREPEVVEVPEPDEDDLMRLLLSSGGGPLNPPKEWFLAPEPDHRQEIVITADGQITGHLVGWRECHNAYAGCEIVEKSRTVPPFLGFHRTEVHCADGTKLAAGWLPIDTTHSQILANGARAAETWGQDQTWEHYENSGTLLAKVRASNGKHGVWLCGALLPGLDERALAIAQGLSVSGHWNVYSDPRSRQQYPDELLAVLGGVPFPGYPETRTRPELLVASGAVVGHVGVPPCDDAAEAEENLMTTELRVDALEKAIGVLLAHAPDEVQVAVIAALAGPDQPPAAEATPETVDAEAEPDEDTGTDDGLTVAEFASYYAKYDQAARDKMAKAGTAMPDGSFPCADREDIGNAIRAVGRASANSAPAIRKHIMKNARRLGAEGMIPESWNPDGTLKA